MTSTDLFRRFKAHESYYVASRWQKPIRDPIRFFRNQMRRQVPPEQGAIQRVPSFHLPEFTIVAGEAVSESIANYGIYEPELTSTFLRLIKPGQAVIDVGMHLGYYTTLFALLVGETGLVHAFEPTPSTRELARHNVDRFTQVQVHFEAVWSSVETMTFYDYGSDWMGFNSFTGGRFASANAPYATPIAVRTTTLDIFRNELQRPVSLIKIDAESAERQILFGAQQLLQSDQPILSLEVGDIDNGLDNGQSSRGLIEFLQHRGYSAWESRAGRLCRHQLRSRYPYDNLIFAPKALDLSNF